MNGDVKTKIIKRNGEEVTFDIDKIINAITKANEEVSKLHQMNEYQIMAIAEKVFHKKRKGYFFILENMKVFKKNLKSQKYQYYATCKLCL